MILPSIMLLFGSMLVLIAWAGLTIGGRVPLLRHASWLAFIGSVCCILAIWIGTRKYLGGGTDSRTLIMLAALSLIIAGAASTVIYELFVKRRMELMRNERLMRRFPGSPWMWEKRWRRKELVYSDNGEVIFSIVIALTVNLGLLLCYLFYRDEIMERLHDQWDGLCIGYVFIMAGLFSLRFAVNSVIKWQKFGISSLELSSVPVAVGGRLKGEIHTRFRLVPAEGFRLALSCISLDVSFRDAINYIPKTILWEAEKFVRINDVRMGSRGISFPVSFVIPVGAAETDACSRERRIAWVLTVNGNVADNKYSAVFKVPVFRTGEQTEDGLCPHGSD